LREHGFETSGTHYPVKQHHIAGEWKPQLTMPFHNTKQITHMEQYAFIVCIPSMYSSKQLHKCVFLFLWVWGQTEIQECNFSIVRPFIIRDSLWIKATDALKSNFIGITTLHVSGSLSAHHQEFLAVHRLWYILCSLMTTICYKFHPTSGSIRSSNWIKCTKADVWLRTPDDGQKGCPKHAES